MAFFNKTNKFQETLNTIKDTIRFEFDIFFSKLNHDMNVIEKDIKDLRKYENRMQMLEETVVIQTKIIEDLASMHGKFEACELFAIKYYRDNGPIVYHNGKLVSKDNMRKCWITWEAAEPIEVEVDT